MHRAHIYLVANLLTLGVGLGTVRAAAPNHELVTFHTADGVRLEGSFYPGAQGKKAPAVLLLHDLQDEHTDSGWDGLAKALQGRGLSVLRFDFRGHGNSTQVSPFFWEVATNRQLVRGYRPGDPPDAIHFKSFARSYYPMLVNDIVAARLYLDERNDAGACNSANLIVIGAGEGAALGALWLSSEAHRYPLEGGPVPMMSSEPMAKDVTCAVFLGADSRVGGRRMPVLEAVKRVGRDLKVPLGFLYADDDKAGADLAGRCVAVVTKGNNDLKWTAAQAVSEEGLGGNEPRRPSARTAKLVLHYVTSLLSEQRVTPDWSERDTDREAFLWSFPGRRAEIAKAERERKFRLVPLQGLGIR